MMKRWKKPPNKYKKNKSFKRGWKCIRPGSPRPNPSPTAWNSPCGNWRVSYSGYIANQNPHYGKRWSVWYVGKLQKITRIPRLHQQVYGRTLRKLIEAFENNRGTFLPMQIGVRFGWEVWKIGGDLFYIHPDEAHFIKRDSGGFGLWVCGGGFLCAAKTLKLLYAEYCTMKLEGKR